MEGLKFLAASIFWLSLIALRGVFYFLNGKMLVFTGVRAYVFGFFYLSDVLMFWLS